MILSISCISLEEFFAFQQEQSSAVSIITKYFIFSVKNSFTLGKKIYHKNLHINAMRQSNIMILINLMEIPFVSQGNKLEQAVHTQLKALLGLRQTCCLGFLIF